MTDLFIWGGPVTSSQPKQVQWQRPTKVLTVSNLGSSANSAAYASFAAGQVAWPALASKAGIEPDELGSLGIGGFSAFHGFANPMLSSDADRQRVCYAHLADACFSGAGATDPKRGYYLFGLEAALGHKLLVVTSNGPWDEDIHYCHDGTCYSLTSGSKCVMAVWDAVRQSTEVSVRTPALPQGLFPPDRAMQMGNFIWLHYEPRDQADPHGMHVHKLAAPLMQFFGAPWMARRTYPGMAEISSKTSKVLYLVGGAAAAGGVWWALKQWKSRNH